MRSKYIIQLLISLLFIMVNISPAFAKGNEQNADLRIIQSDKSEIILEYLLPSYDVEVLVQNGESYQTINIPGTVQSSEPGYPQVPVKGVLLGVPTTRGMALDILEINTQNKGERFPLPIDNFTEEKSRDFNKLGVQTAAPIVDDAHYPLQPVEIVDVGYLRDQAVVQLRLNPVQYNSARRSVKINHRIRFRLSWDIRASSVQSQPARINPIFEPLMSKAIFNYSDLNRAYQYPEISSNNQTATPLASDLNSNPSLKIGVTEPGIYQLTFTEISQAGLNLSGVPTNTLALSNRGNEIPILIQDDGDGLFNNNDSILFYGIPITDVYTTKNIYWLTTDVSGGLRMAEIDGTPGAGTIPTDFPRVLHQEIDSYYWQTMPGGRGQDHWFWGDEFIAPASREYLFSIANISAAPGTATIKVLLKGRTSDPTVMPDHHTKIYLNNQLISDQTWDGLIEFEHSVTVDHALLINGVNTLKIESVGDTTASVDQIHLNWFEIGYRDTYVSENNELTFNPPAAGLYRYQVSGFDTENIMLFNITSHEDVAWVTNTESQNIGGKYRLEFQESALPETKYIALTPTRYKQPASIELEQPSSWKSSENGADYIIITHPDFYTSSLALADYRSNAAGGGFRVAVAKVNDIYDEFNYGIFNPQAIKDFLTFAYQSWQAPAPVYVLLVGEASYDYRGTLQPPLSRVNYVPTQMIDGQQFGQTAYDNWFVQINGDDYIPDLIIGRIPARSASEASSMIAKTIFYEQNPPDASWNRKATFIADADPVFESISNQLAGSLPFTYESQKIYRSSYGGGGDITADISSAINNGSLLVNYIGHGTVDIWAGSGVYTSADVLALNNINKLSVVTVANCLSGFFVGRANPSIAEAFMRLQNKGAVVVWAPTWFGTPADHRILMQRFYDAVFEDDVPSLGAAAWIAEVYLYTLTGPGAELLETYAYFGDPATNMVVFPSEEIYLPIINNGIP